MTRTDVRVSAIIIEDNKILLIHRKKNGEEYWVFPGGGVEDFETVVEGLIREVKEETNQDIIKYKFAFNSFNEASNKDEPFYYCEISDGEPEIVGEETEKHSPENWYQLEWVDLNKVKDIWLVPEDAKHKILKFQNTARGGSSFQIS